MSKITYDLMKQLHFVSEAGNFFMSQKKQKLTGQQRVLAILKLEDGLTQNYLAEVLDLRPSSVAELLKKLENNGDITRTEDENDKRTKHVHLTAAGQKKADEYAAFKNDDYSEDFFNGLNDQEKVQFSDYLQKISDGWDDDFKQNSSKFVDPTDKFKAMLNMRDKMMQMHGDLTPDEFEQTRHEMRERMHQMPFENPCRPHRDFLDHESGHGFENRRHPDFRRDFWRHDEF